MRGVSDLARMTPEAVEAKYGVPPARYPELAALVGETSDNLPGIPGVGPGFAAKWINQYDGLDNVITHADEITGKKGEALRAHLGDVIRNRRLNALVCDLELELLPADLAVRPWDRQEVHNLFDSLEFQVLRNRLFESLTSEEDIEEGGFELAGAIFEDGGVADWLAEAGAEPVGVHARGTWGAGTGRLDGLAFATGTGLAAYVDLAALGPGRRPGPRRVARRRRPGRRCCTTPRARAWRWPPTGGRWPASRATRRWPPTSSGPTSVPTTWPT